jgi:hypothetical protein
MDEAMERFWQDRLRAARGVLPPRQREEIRAREDRRSQVWYQRDRRGLEGNTLRNCEMFLAARQASIADRCKYRLLTGTRDERRKKAGQNKV